MMRKVIKWAAADAEELARRGVSPEPQATKKEAPVKRATRTKGAKK